MNDDRPTLAEAERDEAPAPHPTHPHTWVDGWHCDECGTSYPSDDPCGWYSAARSHAAFERHVASVTDDSDFDDSDFEVPYWTCPYLARYEGAPGHDHDAVCEFGCVDEPWCVTGGPWPQRGDPA